MAGRWSTRSMRVRDVSAMLSACLVGIVLPGCQSAPLRSSVERSVPTQLVADASVSSWQLQKIQREEAVKQAVLEAKHQNKLAQASFEFERWQGEEPPPLVSQETSLCSQHPLPECCPDAGCEPLCVPCESLCVGCDIQSGLPRLWCDAKGIVNWNNMLILTAAGGVAIAIRESELDREVREKVAENPLRWGDASQFLGKVGDVKYQAPLLLGLYGYSVWSQDEELHDVMGTLLSASVITGVSTSALKLITNTDRPTDRWLNGEYGFPSYHTASTFAIAAVLDEYYGCRVGLPAYALATAVGFSRIDEQDHDLSDVVFGGVLGFVIGKAVAGRHLCGNSKIQLSPYFHPSDGTPGVAWETKF